MTGPVNLLLVDDQPEGLLALEAVLADLGQNLVRARSGREALRQLLDREFALILLDVHMPDMDGYETAETIRQRERTKHTPIIFLTASHRSEIQLFEGYSRGAVDYIFKPIEPEVLRSKVKVFIELARREQEVRRLSALELERTRDRLQRVLAATKDTIYDRDVQEDRTWFSDGLQVYGYAERLVKPAWWLERVHPDDRPQVEASLDRALVARQPVLSREYRVRRQDGGWAHVLDRCQLLYEDGRPTRVLGCLSDLTELRQLEAQLHQAQKMETIGQLAGGVAHDFNNLLTAITGYSELVQARFPEGDPGRDEVEEIKKAGQRAAGLVKQLLAFSRRQHLEPKVIDLNDVVRDMDAMLRRLIDQSVRVSTVLAPDLGRVRADPGQLGQVLMNLAVNARDAMAELPAGAEKRLTIETADVELDAAWSTTHVGARPGRYVMLAVSDTGHGMDEATKARIFEPFFTTKAAGAGTGLGLATVYGIVRQSGGTIWVYSEPGHGATFKVYLPRVEAPADADGKRRAAAAAAVAPLAAGETVLVAEDEDGVRALIRRVLELHGYQVLVARDGAEALDLCRRHPGSIDLAVADLVMPGMGGHELADKLRAARPGVRVLHLSGFSGGAIAQRGALAPGSQFLQKPFTPDLFARKVREVLDAP